MLDMAMPVAAVTVMCNHCQCQTTKVCMRFLIWQWRLGWWLLRGLIEAIILCRLS